MTDDLVTVGGVVLMCVLFIILAPIFAFSLMKFYDFYLDWLGDKFRL